jgi:nucleotide-binding universal stress UspA family protein
MDDLVWNDLPETHQSGKALSMQDVLVLSDGTANDESRFACAESLAQRGSARINIVVATELPGLQAVRAETAMYHYNPPDTTLRDKAAALASSLQASVEERFRRHPTPVAVFRLESLRETLGQAVAELARTHDLFLTTLPADAAESEQSALVLESVLLEGGRGVLGLPSGAACDGGFDVVTLAWNNSRVCTRALSEALPFLERAREVFVLEVDQLVRRDGREYRDIDNVIRHLDRHGIKATLVKARSGEMDTSEAILSEAVRMKTDLLVMGVQTDGGLLNWFNGDVSRGVMSASTIPLLMAH